MFILAAAILAGNIQEDPDVLVGRRNGMPYAFEAESIYCRDVDGEPAYLEKRAAMDFNKLRAAAKVAGYEIQVTYAFRDHEKQKAIKKRNRRLAAKPGHSPHEMGIAVDLGGTRHGRRKTPFFKWLKENAGRFNFSLPLKKEPWHIEHHGQQKDPGLYS